MKKNNLKELDSLIELACNREEPYIIQITSLKELFEMSGMATGGVAFAPQPTNNKEKKKVRKEVQTEMMLRKYIRKKAESVLKQKQRELCYI